MCKNIDDENIIEGDEDVAMSSLHEVFTNTEDKLIFELGEENYDFNKITRAANFSINGNNLEAKPKQDKEKNQNLALSSLIDVMKSNDQSQIYVTEFHK